MRVVTRCKTEDDFISSFHPFVTDSTCFIPTTAMKTPGIETGFSIRLADGAPMLRGLCVVLDAWPTADNPYNRPGVWIGLRGLTSESKLVHQRLQLARTAAEEEQSRATVQMPPLFPEPAPGSSFVLPANPLTGVEDAALDSFVDCMMYEDDDQDTTRPIAAPTPTQLSEVAIPVAAVTEPEITEPIATTTVEMPPLPLPPVLPAGAAPSAVDEHATAPCKMSPDRSEIATLLGVAPISAVPVAITAAAPAEPTRIAMPPQIAPTMVIPRIRVTEAQPWWQRAVRSIRRVLARLRVRTISRRHRARPSASSA